MNRAMAATVYNTTAYSVAFVVSLAGSQVPLPFWGPHGAPPLTLVYKHIHVCVCVCVYIYIYIYIYTHIEHLLKLIKCSYGALRIRGARQKYLRFA